MIELGLAELAQNFWDGAVRVNDGLEAAIVMTLPIVPARISQLTLYKALAWLKQRGVVLPGLEQVQDRPLRACLIAQGAPNNFILWDDSDAPADQLFSLAHEVAHFLLDYEQPREQALSHLGPQILEVFDGGRTPTIEERLHGLIAGVQVRPRQHFMERATQGDILSRQVLEIENRADILALELLAPQEQALALVQTVIKGQPLYTQRLEAATTLLISQYKLAPNVARAYVEQLLVLAGGSQSFQEWLKS